MNKCSCQNEKENDWKEEAYFITYRINFKCNGPNRMHAILKYKLFILVPTLWLSIYPRRFKEEAMRISRLMKDSPQTPLEKTGDWIEYVLRHGGARHLRPQVFNIPWYQYYLLDVMAFLVTVVALVVMVIRLLCRCLCRLCCGKGSNKTKKE